MAGSVALFGRLRSKIAFDLYERRPYAFGILRAADEARSLGLDRIAVGEFRVANGVGLRSMGRIARAVSEETAQILRFWALTWDRDVAAGGLSRSSRILFH
jgi:hypothetical protein